MPRPRIDQTEQLSERVTLRFSPAEIAAVRSKAETARRSVSAFARAAILRGKVQVAMKAQADAALIAELKRIGVNLNQIARAVNANGGQVPPELVYVLDQLEQLVMELIGHGSEGR